MPAAAMPNWSLRLEQAEFNRLARAFIISVALHVLVFGTYHTGKKLNWWDHWHTPTWVKTPKMLTQILKKASPAQKKPETQEVPLMFVDVDPLSATAEPPKNAKYYSDKNALAANPEPTRETGTPLITGKQEQVLRTADVPREVFKPLEPAKPPEPAPIAKEEQQEVKAKPAMTPGDLALGKAEPKPRTDQGQAAQPRPRSVREYLARNNLNRLPGEKIKQDGGVSRHLIISSLDTKATAYGNYDAALIAAISQCWYKLLDDRQYASDSRGRVVLQFKLHYDGRITDLNVAENTVGEMLSLLCQKAVQEPSPFAKWPSEMRRVLGDTRNIQFTFYYN